MSIQERRKSKRSSAFLIVNFRNLKSFRQHSSGITANFSHEGIGLESQSIYFMPGEILEIILKDPRSELSVSAEGELIWKRDRWYKCEMGIKLRREVGTDREIFELLSNSNKTPAEPPSPDADSKRSVSGEKEIKTEEPSIDQARSDSSTAKAPKMDEVIYLGAIERKISDKEGFMIDALILNDKVNKKPSDQKNKTNFKKESGSGSEGVVLKEAFMSIPQKKNRTLIVLLIFLSFVLLAAAALKFNDIKKAIPLNIQADRLIFSRNPPERKDVSLIDSELTNGSAVAEPAEPMRVSDDRHIDHAALPAEANNIDAKKSPSVNEGILHVNDLRVTIIFDYNSDIIEPGSDLKIENIANALHARPESTVRVEGYSDDLGPEMYNLDLSMRRSLAVKKMLIRKGIDSARIKVAFWGEANPVASNQTADGRMRNRRVEMQVRSDNL